MVLRPFPRKVAPFTKHFIFTTLTTTEVQRAARDPFVHPETKKPCSLWTLDDKVDYTPFALDFGPFNICYVFEALILIHEKLHPKGGLTKPVCLFTSVDPGRKASVALVACLYFMCVEHWAPHEVYQSIADFELVPFRDAGKGYNEHGLSVQDCLYGLNKAMDLDLLELNTFSPEWYRYHEQVINGDLNVLGPFIPFASPIEVSWCNALKIAREQIDEGKNPEWPPPKGRTASHAFKTVLNVFRQQSVGLVIRLNDQLYDSRHFTDRGIQHEEMYFDDGSNPSDDIVRRFIAICEQVIEVDRKKVAVHCKAGLGRTGVLIGAYFIYKHRFTAQEIIAYMRMVRPGMVVGPQQRYLMENQMKWVEWSVIDNLGKDLKIADEMEMDIVNPLATPPAEIDIPLPITSPLLTATAQQRLALEDLTEKLQSKTSREALSNRSIPNLHHESAILVKGGDAVGQPRKSPSGGHQSVPAIADPEHVEVHVRPASPVQVSSLPVRSSSVPRSESTATTASRGIKRAADRSSPPRSPQMPQRVSCSPASQLVVPGFTLQRSGSTASVASSSGSDIGGPARKRPAYAAGASSPHGRTGLSSPPISRETSPAAEGVISTSRIPSMTRVANKLRRKTTPISEGSASPPSSMRSTPPSSITEERMSLLPTRRTVLPKEKMFPQTLPTLDETAERASASRRKGLTPPKWTARFGSPSL